MAWCLFAIRKVSIYCCLFAIRKVSISITAGTASANTEINVEKATNRRQAGVQSNLPGQPEWPGVEGTRVPLVESHSGQAFGRVVVSLDGV